MAHSMETSEMPSGPEPKTPEGLEKKPELPEAAAEAPEDAPEVDSAVEDAGKEFEAAGAELTTFGSAELARVTAEATPDELDDPELAAARQEIDDVAAQGKAATEKHKGRLASIGSKLKRWGRAALAGAVISGSAMPAGEAMAAGPDRGPKVEHVEKGKQAPRWTEVVAATENDAMNDADLLAERGEAGRKEFVEATKSFDQELARKDAAELAGLDVAKLGKDGFKKVEIWSEKTFRDRQNREFPPLPDSMDAQADNDEIRLRPSRFLEADGSVDAGKVKKGLTHEFLHVVATTENADGQQERLWDKAGVSHELNEGVTELYALRIAQKEGVKIENHQAYAGGNLVAARLIEGVVGQKALYADYVEGKTDRLKAGLDAKFSKGSADKILAKRMEVGEEGDALAIVMELARSGA